MTEPIDRAADTREEAHSIILAGYELAKVLVQQGRRVRIRVEEDQDDLTLQQRRFYRGPVLQQISEQAHQDGQRYGKAVWHELFRGQFLGSRWELVGGRPVELRVSTEDLGIRDYSEYIDKVLAEAATVWGVEFHFDIDQREAVRYRPRRAEAPA